MMDPRRRITYAVLISIVVHVLCLISIYGRGGGGEGPLRYAGLMVDIVPVSAIGARTGMTDKPTPFPQKAPEVDAFQKPLLAPVPALSETMRLSKRESVNRSDRDTKDLPGKSGGLSPGSPEGEDAASPDVNIDSVRDRDGGPRGDGDEYEGYEMPFFQNARCASCPSPSYPPLARARGLDGEVVLNVQILSDGRVGDVYVVSSPGHPLLENEAIAAVKSWTFFPATEDGQAVSSNKKVRIPFRLAPP